ncbi:DNA gyrase subunit A [Gammaproteobacteria bacterium]|jgi:DNA gyrase subunit A|nr:DNA gyrase subunit A [Gammaproteobacteria bacterium]
MASVAKEIISVNLEDEMRRSYLDYAMSVIVGRALPDVRDGLKPVHRRALFAMHVLGNDWNKAYKKSARVVGDVIGKYHPHGDTAVYDTIVRMAQDFSMRYPLVDGQGNFGSVDGDAPAAMRYTEVRMAKIAHQVLADLEKETVDFTANYDESEHEPSVMPSRVPNLLVNGSSGIAVGMATNIPPHNLTEVINACLAMIEQPDITVAELIEIMPGPDFPTSAIINGRQGIHEAYETGRGRVHIRSRSHIEVDEKSSKEKIVVTELPYQVNKARLLEKIAELVKEKKIEGITELRDESDKDGIRVVIELRRGEVSEVILNNLYKQTQMQNVFGINMVALVDGQPRLLTLRQVLQAFLRHRRDVVTRRTIFELRKAREKAHVLEGQAVALANIDEVIAMIKASSNPAEARAALLQTAWQPGAVTDMLQRAGADASRPENITAEMGLHDGQYFLSEVQAQAILDLRLHRLTGLEQDKIVSDYAELLSLIEGLLLILSSPEKLMQVIQEELAEIKENFGDERRTEISSARVDLSLEDLIQEEDVVVTLSHAGYAKSQPLDVYQAQHRGGRGKAATSVKDEDFVDNLFVANTHDTILCFSSLGKVYWMKVYELPQAGRTSRGKPIVNLLPLQEDERINAILPVKDFTQEAYVFMATSQGVVKKTPLEDFSRPRSSGIIALDLREGDHLIGVEITTGEYDVILVASTGKSIRFAEQDVRPMGRTATGVRGMRIDESHEVISVMVVEHNDETHQVLIGTANGFGKRTPMQDFPQQKRGGQGVIAVQTTDRNGDVIGAVMVAEDDQAMLITDQGTLVRTAVHEISSMGRNTQGVTLIRLGEDEHMTEIEAVQTLEGADDAIDSADDASVDDDSSDSSEPTIH